MGLIINNFDDYLICCIESEYSNIKILKNIGLKNPEYIGFINLRIKSSENMIKKFSEIYYILFLLNIEKEKLENFLNYDSIYNDYLSDVGYVSNKIYNKTNKCDYKIEKRLNKYLKKFGNDPFIFKQIIKWLGENPYHLWYKPLCANNITKDFLYKIHNQNIIL